PNTVAHAVKSAVDSGASMLTVHASGGAAVLRAAGGGANHRGAILSVAGLTRLNDEDMQENGFFGTTGDEALRMAALARSAGCDAVVTSAREVAAVRRMLGEGFGIVVPGIRPLGATQDDQSRVATPAQAIQAGATQIVVGRPITRATDPVKAVNAILEEMAGAVVGR